jgi:hypothetical protein
VLATATITVAAISTGIGAKVTKFRTKFVFEFVFKRDFLWCIATWLAWFAWFTWTTVVTITSSTTSTVTVASTTVVAVTRATVVTTLTAFAATAATTWDVVAFIVDWSEADLALVVNVVNANADDIAKIQDVFHIVHALAVTKLRDVHESVTSGKDVDECTELGGAHNATVVDGVQLCGWRIDDCKDAIACLFYAETVR